MRYPSLLVPLLSSILCCISTVEGAHPFENRQYGKEGRICFGCFEVETYPTFDIINKKVEKKQTPKHCYFHTYLECNPGDPNVREDDRCFMSVALDKDNKKVASITKGCKTNVYMDENGMADRQVKTWCSNSYEPMSVSQNQSGTSTPTSTTEDPITAYGKTQTCFCSKRFCNADLSILGGDQDLVNKIYVDYNSEGLKNIASWGWIVVAGMRLFL